jgi:serine/threonine-protein kinase
VGKEGVLYQPGNEGLQFGTSAIQLGFVSAKQVQECLRDQQKLLEMKIQVPLGEILFKKGYLNKNQRQLILEKIGVHTDPINGYELICRLGQGGMGTVYKARQVSMDHPVAIKIMRPELARDDEFVDQMAREARAAAKLTHPNIVSAHDFLREDNSCCFIMEFVDGSTLDRILDLKGPRTPGQTADIMVQVARALDYLSQHQMVHQDIKPGNLIISDSGMVKLCDFGLARQNGGESVSDTGPGWTAGTPQYMSPEQIRNDDVIDARSDIYSLGATMYHALIGWPPFTGALAKEIMDQHLTEPVPPIRRFRPDVPVMLESIMMKCLRKDPAERYKDAGELVRDLEGFLRRRSIRRALNTNRRRAHSPRPWLKPLIIVGSLAAAAGLTLLGLSLFDIL